MSLGSIIGGVAGGVIGFFAGGPTGAYYGAVIGFGIGMAIDPITPDIPAIGIPDPQQQVMNGEIGGPVADLCGTAKVVGKLLFFGKERNEKVYSEASGGGGKGGAPEPQQQQTGYKYFQSWGVGLVACPTNPVDVLYAIYKNDDKEAVWPIFDTQEDEDAWEGLPLPVSGGQETIVIEGIGSVIFSFGTDDQMPIDAVGEIITDSTLNTPYRFLCWAFFDDCYIGEYNRTPTYKFILKKIPQIDAMPTYGEIQTYDCNPAHALYYIFNILSGLNISWLDAVSFNNVATTLFSENRGICILLEQQQSALNYIENINGHVDNIVRYDSDGKFHLKLIRDDYVVGDLQLIDESVMLENPTFNRGSWINTINETKIQYTEIYNVSRTEGVRANLYGNTGSILYGAYFDGESLSHIANYSVGAMGAILAYQGDVALIVGEDLGARIHLIDSDTVTLDSINDPGFGIDDIRNGGRGHLVAGATDNIIYFADRNGSVQEITDLIKTAGDDSMTPSSTDGFAGYHSNFVYTTSWGTPTSYINRVNAATFLLDYRTSTPAKFPNKFTIYNNLIYSIAGTFLANLEVFNLTAVHQFSGDTSFGGAGNIGDIVESGGYIIITHTGGLFKFRSSDGVLLDSLTGSSHDFDRLWKISNVYVMAWRGSDMAVYDIIKMEVVDIIATGIASDGKSVTGIVL